MADKIDVARLHQEADALATESVRNGPTQNTVAAWSQARDEHFARLVMEECAKVCDGLEKDIVCPEECAAAIRARMP
jgi:hypothetical protein